MLDNIIQWDKDVDGIVMLIMDDFFGLINVMNEVYIELMGKVVDCFVVEKDLIIGVVVVSVKKIFFVGGDVKMMIQVRFEDVGDVFNIVEIIKWQLCILEILGKLVVVVINGVVLGGGLEIVLVCYYWIVVDVKGSQFGLLEVMLGLLLGGGGVICMVWMFGIQNVFVSVLV